MMKRLQNKGDQVKKLPLVDEFKIIVTVSYLLLLPIVIFGIAFNTGGEGRSPESQSDGQDAYSKYIAQWYGIDIEDEQDKPVSQITSLGDTTGRIDQDVIIKDEKVNGETVEKSYMIVTRENKDGSKKIISEKEMILEKSE